MNQKNQSMKNIIQAAKQTQTKPFSPLITYVLSSQLVVEVCCVI
jgi:hypothetical protein